MLTSLLVSIGIALVALVLIVGLALLWSGRQDRAEAKKLRERRPEATLPPFPRHDDTDRWNLTP